MATRRDESSASKSARNADPITDESGAHPIGAGAGAALAGAAAGAAGGALGGPVGAVIGAVVGGVAGGLGGKAVAEQVDPTVETAYWKKQYPQAKYYDKKVDYSTVEPAYRYGWESRGAHAERSFEDAERDLEREWQQRRGNSNLSWEQARPATRDAWDRIDREYGKRAPH